MEVVSNKTRLECTVKTASKGAVSEDVGVGS